jgi:hypothetical protein
MRRAIKCPFFIILGLNFGAGQISYGAFVQNPKLLKNVTRKGIFSDDMNGNLFATWGSNTGRCTPFAIKAVNLIEKKYPGQFKFDLYDLNGHRIARCHKMGILIDSSSRHGAFEFVRIMSSLSGRYHDGSRQLGHAGIDWADRLIEF